ncbi:conjugal transfer protein TrbD [Ralstonia thomasii]|uniref:conjugal transfer protein TrbD n=1 Tax=Ralstonia thomasii TaxID=3058596 RepID=UPI003C2E1F9A
MNEPRKVPLRKSLNRPILVGGGERTLMYLLVVGCAMLVFGVGSKEGIVAGILLWVAGHWALVKMAKADPQMFDVYKRHRLYQIFYPALAHFTAPTSLPKSQQIK